MTRLPISSYALVAANLIPLVGVLFYDWNAILVLALFWIENLIIGGFNVVRMVTVSVRSKEWSGLFKSVFFIFHYGAFCVVHGSLLTKIIGYPEVQYITYFEQSNFPLAEIFLEGVAVFLSFIDNLAPEIWLGMAALVLSRFVSFIENFILRGEIFTARLGKLMKQPYQQIIVMHIGLVVGAMILQKLNSPVWLLALIVLLKIFFDFKQHKKRHENEQGEYSEVIKDI